MARARTLLTMLQLVCFLACVRFINFENDNMPDSSTAADASADVVPDADVDTNADVDTDASSHELIQVECEDGAIWGDMETIADTAALGGIAVQGSVGSGDFFWDDYSPMLPPNRVEIPVFLNRGGDYRVWVRSAAPEYENDALYAGFSVTDLRRFWPPNPNLDWFWVTQSAGDADRLLFINLSPGEAMLYIGSGEEQARCDSVMITSDLSFVPYESP